VSRLGLGTFKSRSLLDFLLKVSVSSRLRASMSRLGLEDFGRDSSSARHLFIIKSSIKVSANTNELLCQAISCLFKLLAVKTSKNLII